MDLRPGLVEKWNEDQGDQNVTAGEVMQRFDILSKTYSNTVVRVL